MCRSPSDSTGCYRTTFSVNHAGFNKICGKIKGYQKGSTDAFQAFSNSPSLDNGYVDGMSITVGNPRKHVWTYAVGLSVDGDFTDGIRNCPCARNRGIAPLSFVGEHFYCESGNTGGFVHSQYHTDD